MKPGKVSETVLKRSVFKQMHLNREDVLFGAGVGADCAALRLEANEVAVLTTDPVIWKDDKDGGRAVYSVCNDLACSGAEPVGLLLNALLPEEIEEPQIRNMVKVIAGYCEPMGVQLLGGHTEVTDAVNRPVIAVTGVGKADRDQVYSSRGVKPGDDIVITKWIGLEGTWRLAQAKMEELVQRYPRYMMEEAADFHRYLSVWPEAKTAMETGVHVMHDISEGGVFGALWELAEGSGVGLEIDMKKIPLRQETVEICEFCGVNPYQLVSGGSMLMATEDGNALVAALEQAGIPAVVVGKATDGNDRVLLNEEERRFMERPQMDEIRRMGL